MGFVEKGKSTALRGLRSRKQRLAEYYERRAHVVGLPMTVAERERERERSRVGGRKRRRGWDWPVYQHRRVPSATVLDTVVEVDLNEATYHPDPEEDAQMSVQTVTFGVGPAGDIQAGFKFEADVLRDVLFPPAVSSSSFVHPPPRKKRKIDARAVDPALNIDALLPPVRSVILETEKERYLLSPCIGTLFVEYDVSLVLDAEVDEEVGVLEGASAAVVRDTDTARTAVLKDVVIPPPLSPGEIRDEASEEMMSGLMADNDDDGGGGGGVNEKTLLLPEMNANEDKPKQMMLQTLQRNLGEDMFRFAKEGVYVTDMMSEEMDVDARTEWIVQVKRWKWGPS
ncbi:hypothetical protein C0989_011755 [Termitomyces sp. Mn162]|nr:hypothetical protein C0989_011755 [Termitomyces sp. Mn162]